MTVPGLGLSYSAFVETKDLYGEELEVVKFFQRLRFAIDRVDETVMTVQLKTRDSHDEVLVDHTPVLLNGGSPVHQRLKGTKMFRLKFLDPVVAVSWRLSMFEPLGQLGGRLGS